MSLFDLQGHCLKLLWCGGLSTKNDIILIYALNQHYKVKDFIQVSTKRISFISSIK